VNSPAEDPALVRRAARHAALGDPARLALVEELVVSDRSPKELAELLGLGSNLLAHHLDVLEEAGLVTRSSSAGDGRRKYVRLVRDLPPGLALTGRPPAGELVFLCTHNSARSQLAAALWSARTGRPASSAGTRPAARVHRGAVAAARRAGLSLDGATPRMVGRIPRPAQVVTVCDLAHEELAAEPGWWHWSIPDPAETGTPAAFDAVVEELEARTRAAARAMDLAEGAAT
jgi:protein-tyrosine-phosphatase